MTNVSQYGADRRMLAETSVASVCPPNKSDKSATRADIALLVSALFLQRFSLPLGNSFIHLDLVAATLIFAHQFASGRLLIQYDRLLLFLAMGLSATSSLLLNFGSTTLSSYSLFLVVYSLFTFSRPSAPDRYKGTLQGFQFLVLILSCLGIAQFVAQFVVDSRQLIRFFGIVPDFLYATTQTGDLAVNTIIPITPGSSLIKSNGIFLAEPSSMSQIAALGILIEILEFRRPRYLILLALGLLLSYSGTGITILLLSLPLAGLANRRAQLPALLVSLFAFGLLATGIINLSAFTSRVDEFDNTGASGSLRFIAPFSMAADHFDTASLPVLLGGNGPGTLAGFVPHGFYVPSSNAWIKLLYEYGLIGAFVFTCFLGSCFRRSRCPKPLIAALIYGFVFTSGDLVTTSFLIIMVVLCTLSGPEAGQRRIDVARGYRPFVASPS
jgi:hypothetical protein